MTSHFRGPQGGTLFLRCPRVYSGVQFTKGTSTMDRDHGFAKSTLKVAASVLGGLLLLGPVLIFVLSSRVYPNDFTPSSLWTDLATIPILLSVPAALVIAWGLHYWRKSHPVDLILLGDLGDKDDRL